MATGGKQFGILAEDFVSPKTSQAFERLVGQDGEVVSPGNDDALRGVLENAGGQFELLLGLLVKRDVLRHFNGTNDPLAIKQRFGLKGQVTPSAIGVVDPAFGLVPVAGKLGFSCRL